MEERRIESGGVRHRAKQQHRGDDPRCVHPMQGTGDRDGEAVHRAHRGARRIERTAGREDSASPGIGRLAGGRKSPSDRQNGLRLAGKAQPGVDFVGSGGRI